MSHHSMLWPRQEVLQLIIPQLLTTRKNVFAVIKQLSKHQTTEGKISFDRWLVGAKDILKWNDNCMQLFWDMLLMAVWYILIEQQFLHNQSNDEIDTSSVDIEHLSIFLILHINDVQIRPISPSAGYDTMWPLQNSFDNDNILSSPIKGGFSSNNNSLKSSVSPKSPRSPSSSNRPTSPKRSHLTSPRHFKSQSYYMQFIRQKMPLILQSIAIDESNETSSPLDNSYENNNANVDCMMINKKSFDCLNIILGGGFSKENQIGYLSLLHPLWQQSSLLEAVTLTSSIDSSHMIDVSSYIPISLTDVSTWLDSSLVCNEVYYPNSIQSNHQGRNIIPNALFGSSSHHNIDHNSDDKFIHSNDLSPSPKTPICTVQNQPIRQIIPLSALNRSKSTSLNGYTTTIIHLVTNDLNNNNLHNRSKSSNTSSKSIKKSSSMHIDNDAINSDSGAMSDGGSTGDTDIENEMDNGDDTEYNFMNQFKHKGRGLDSNNLISLPQLTLTNCSKSIMYLLSPYMCGNITNCSDCEFVIGAISGTLILSGCERLKLTVSCNKLIVHNCLECEIHIACMNPTVISGDSRSLLFGPFNTTYSQLKSHLKQAQLLKLCDDLDSNITGKISNHWADLCDLNLCLETVASACSPTGYAIDAADSQISLPSPHHTTASILSADRFMFICIPYLPYHQTSEFCPIPLPESYRQKINHSHETLKNSQEKMKYVYQDVIKNVQKNLNKADDIGANELISKKFMEWLISQGKVPQLLDLIKIDGDKISNTNGQGHNDERNK